MSPGRSGSLGTTFATAVGAVAAAVALASAPAHAHGGDPTLVPVVREVSPALPVDVVVQVRTTVSEQMIVGNPTTTPLLVLDPAGVPFLRVSRSGAAGNVANAYFHRTLNPSGVQPRIPASVRAGGTERWVPLARGSSWGWFEPRLHPFEPGTEPGTGTGTDVATWRVGLRYGTQSVRVEGALERRTVTGSFLAQADPRSDRLTVSIAQGPTPAVLLVAPESQRIEVAGRDGKPFVRLDSTGAYANSASVSFRDNPDFLDAAGKRTGWVKVGAPGRVRWLDPRLQYSADRPPEVVERAAERAELGRWEIPLTVDGTTAPLQGTLSWIPAGGVPVAGTGDNTSDGDFPWAAGLAGGAVGAGVLALAVSRGRARRVDA